MSVLKNPYRGVRGLRYSFMEQNAPEDLARMEAAGETEEYLKAVERNYLSGLFRARSFSEIASFLCVILGIELLHAFGTVLLFDGIDPIDAVVYIALPCSVLDCVLGVLIYLAVGKILLNRPLQPERRPFKPRKL